MGMHPQTRRCTLLTSPVELLQLEGVTVKGLEAANTAGSKEGSPARLTRWVDGATSSPLNGGGRWPAWLSGAKEVFLGSNKIKVCSLSTVSCIMYPSLNPPARK
eukprot:295336-Prorocentrum_minimum.AAC.1